VKHDPYVNWGVAVCEIAVFAVHYLFVVVLASCYGMFSWTVGTMTGGQYYAVKAKYMEYCCNNGLIIESVTFLFAGGLIAE
jgi:hypothetical protein